LGLFGWLHSAKISERLAEANSRTAAVLVDELDARLFERDSDSMRSMLSAAELAVYRLHHATVDDELRTRLRRAGLSGGFALPKPAGRPLASSRALAPSLSNVGWWVASETYTAFRQKNDPVTLQG